MLRKGEFEYKMAIILRKDLGMGVGKLVSQACHACIEVSNRQRKSSIWRQWEREGGKKVVLRVQSLQDLLELEDGAKRENLPFATISDRGLTQIPPNTATALAIGPAEAGKIDKVTGHLKLL
ncbi:MAG: peptidyl-tRNA hydrolase Pth2 [Nitrososphaerales archaeon]